MRLLMLRENYCAPNEKLQLISEPRCCINLF